MAITAQTQVLTHDYWKLAQDIVPGDILFDRLGRPVRVKLAQQYRSEHCYEVQLHDGLTVCGDDKLKLPLETIKYRRRALEYKGHFKFRRPLSIRTVDDLTQTPLINKNNNLEFSIPTAGPLQFPTQPLPVPPFVFGFWFFNHRTNQMMVPPPGCSKFVHEKFADAGYRVEETWKHTSGETSFITHPSVYSHLVPNVPQKIPNNYLFGSPEQRLELLSGILHSRSRRYDAKRDRFRFTSKNALLAKQVQYLAESLGCKTRLDAPHPRNGNVLFIWTKHKLMEQQTPKPVKIRQNWRLVTNIRPISDQLCVHIETDGEDNTFLVGEGFISVC